MEELRVLVAQLNECTPSMELIEQVVAKANELGISLDDGAKDGYFSGTVIAEM